MKTHAVPHDIMGVEFKLFGNFMSLREFIYVAASIAIAYFFYILKQNNIIPGLLAWPAILLLGGGGIIMGLVPYQDRTLDQWLINYFVAIKCPTQRIWSKPGFEPTQASDNQTVIKKHHVINSPTSGGQTQSDPQSQDGTQMSDIDKGEKEQLNQISEILAQVEKHSDSQKTTVSPQPAPQPVPQPTPQPAPQPVPQPAPQPTPQPTSTPKPIATQQPPTVTPKPKVKPKSARILQPAKAPIVPSQPTPQPVSTPMATQPPTAMPKQTAVPKQTAMPKQTAVPKQTVTPRPIVKTKIAVKPQVEPALPVKRPAEVPPKPTVTKKKNIPISRQLANLPEPRNPSESTVIITKRNIDDYAAKVAGIKEEKNTVNMAVKDKAGKMIQGVTCITKNAEGKPVRASVSNQLGHIINNIPLQNGRYNITLSKQGYKFPQINLILNDTIIPTLNIKAL